MQLCQVKTGVGSADEWHQTAGNSKASRQLRRAAKKVK